MTKHVDAGSFQLSS